MASSSREAKWTSLEHNGPVFHEPYQGLPDDVQLTYDGKKIHLSKKTEEIAGFYAKLLDKKCIKKVNFKKKFFNDWRKSMTAQERKQITDPKKCNFKSIQTYFKDLDKNRTEEEKAAIKRKANEIKAKYGYCTIDENREEIGNYHVERPGLFCGLGENPKNGMVKRRIMPEHVTINCSEGNTPKPPKGHEWKAVKHDSAVMWVASWKDEIQNTNKYINLHRNSTLKSNNDQDKFNTARELGNKIEGIRNEYRADWNNSDQYKKQRSVALYFIDTLALRPGNKKKEDRADTVGCCSLRVKHVTLHEPNVVGFDFIGKSSIPYQNNVTVDKVVFENLKSFRRKKKSGNDLFDLVNAQNINDYLYTLIPGLTAKVFRTYNASCTMEEKLNELTKPDDTVEDKIKSYKEALSLVVKLCNHTSEGTSESNYIHPRIIVAWCKKNEVPIEKVFTPYQLDIFKWAMAIDPDYRFKIE